MAGHLEAAQLRHFALLDTLSEIALARLAQHAGLRVLAPGEVLFEQGARDGNAYFLLAGRVELVSDTRRSLIEAGTEAARMPLARLKPRRYTARAEGRALVAEIDEAMLEAMLAAEHAVSYKVNEIEGDDPELMFQLFSLPAFRKLPTANLSAMLGRLEPVDVRSGQVIVRQGEPGDYYYLIRDGQAEVWRALGDQPQALVARLHEGDGFGEEALLSGEARNATVVMTTGGRLMRLARTDFDHLLKASLVHWVDPDQAAQLIGQGARFLDVRCAQEFSEYSLPGSINMPLHDLRKLSAALEPGRVYILVCENGMRAAAGAFLLAQRGFDTRVLKDGLQVVRRHP